MTKISRMNSLTFSRRSAAAAMKKLTFLLFMLVVCIFLFQYMGLGGDNASSRVHSAVALRDNPNPIVLLYSNTSKSKVNGSYSSFTKRRITGSPPSNSTTTTTAAAAASARTSGVSGLNMEIPREYSGRRIYSFKEIVQMLFEGHQSAYSKKPLWSTKADKQLIYTKSEMEKPVDKKYTPSSYKDKDGMYAPLYHNLTLFKRNYELMEKTLKIYIYKEGEDPIFHHPDFLTGTYGVEGWFMKILESSSNLHNFVTENPDEAQLFYIPFSSVHLRIKLGDSPGKATHIRYLKNYLDMIVDKYPYWNRTGGADHFFVACHDWSEFITRHIMSSCIRALCDSDIYNPFIYGKDVSLPTTRVYGSTNPLLNVGGQSPSKRKTLAFFAGQMHGYIRPILLHHWENNIDPDIKVYGSSIAINGSADYISYMRGSKYCICPRGFASFGPRFMEAIYFECVPVLISDNYIPPFSDVLNWETFAVFVKEKDIPRLKEILIAIPERSYLRMYMRVKMVQRHFLWHNQPIKYDVFHMILYSVWINRVLQFQPAGY